MSDAGIITPIVHERFRWKGSQMGSSLLAVALCTTGDDPHLIVADERAVPLVFLRGAGEADLQTILSAEIGIEDLILHRRLPSVDHITLIVRFDKDERMKGAAIVHRVVAGDVEQSLFMGACQLLDRPHWVGEESMHLLVAAAGQGISAALTARPATATVH